MTEQKRPLEHEGKWYIECGRAGRTGRQQGSDRTSAAADNPTLPVEVKEAGATGESAQGQPLAADAADTGGSMTRACLPAAF